MLTPFEIVEDTLDILRRISGYCNHAHGKLQFLVKHCPDENAEDESAD